MKTKHILNLVSLLALACGQKREPIKPEDYVRDNHKVMFSSPIKGYIALSDVSMPFVLHLGDIGGIENMVLVTYNISNGNRREVCEHRIDPTKQDDRISTDGRFVTLLECALGFHEISEGGVHVLPYGDYEAKILIDAERGNFFDNVTYNWSQ